MLREGSKLVDSKQFNFIPHTELSPVNNTIKEDNDSQFFATSPEASIRVNIFAIFLLEIVDKNRWRRRIRMVLESMIQLNLSKLRGLYQ
jgi:hypothetical protein